MKLSRRCPKCSRQRILKVSEVTDKAPGEGGGVLSIFARITDDGPDLGEWESRGIFEAYVCASCGYTEWFVQDPESIPIDGDVVELLEPLDHKGPYR